MTIFHHTQLPIGTYFGEGDTSGQCDGRGLVMNNSGTFYWGELKNGNRHGWGCHGTKGKVYFGEWRDDKKEGWGCEITSNASGESTYIGTFRNDLKDGIGFLLTPSEALISFWRQGQLHGESSWIDLKEKVFHFNDWKDGCHFGRHFEAPLANLRFPTWNGERYGIGIYLQDSPDTLKDIQIPFPSQPDVLLLKTAMDPNEAFANPKPEHEWLSSLFPQIRCIHLSPAGDVDKLIDQCQREQKQYDLLLIRAHGLKDSMCLYQPYDMTVAKLAMLVQRTTHPDSVIVLDSCSTGTSHKSGLAKTLSKIHPDRWIVAPAVNSCNIGFERVKDHLVVRVYNDLAQRIERVFHNGRLMNAPFKEGPSPLL